MAFHDLIVPPAHSLPGTGNRAPQEPGGAGGQELISVKKRTSSRRRRSGRRRSRSSRPSRHGPTSWQTSDSLAPRAYSFTELVARWVLASTENHFLLIPSPQTTSASPPRSPSSLPPHCFPQCHPLPPLSSPKTPSAGICWRFTRVSSP